MNMAYIIICSECELEEVLYDLTTVLDLQDAHQETHSEEHIFEFRDVERTDQRLSGEAIHQ